MSEKKPAKRRRAWSTMTRAELLEEKTMWEAQLQALNHQIKSAGRLAKATQEFMPRAEFQALQDRRMRLAAGLRGICAELSKLSQKQKLPTFEEFFYDAADEILPDDLFNRIYDRAEALMASAGKET